MSLKRPLEDQPDLVSVTKEATSYILLLQRGVVKVTATSTAIQAFPIFTINISRNDFKTNVPDLRAVSGKQASMVKASIIRIPAPMIIIWEVRSFYLSRILMELKWSKRFL